MSAFYAVAYSDRIELLTDGAVYAEDGTLVDIRQKVWTSEYAPVAVTGRGNVDVVTGFASAILCLAVCGSFDATIAAVQDLLDRRSEKGVPDDVEMLICGISETGGPRIFYLVTRDVHDAGIEPWRLVDVGQELGGGNPLTEDERAGLDASDGLLGIAVPLFEAMRSKRGINPARPDLPDHYGIGGHIDLTVVAPGGCTVERIHEWPDVVGEKIDPTKRDRLAGGMTCKEAAPLSAGPCRCQAASGMIDI